MTYDDLRTAIRNWVLANTSNAITNIIFEQENGVRPPKPYISVNIITNTQIGWRDNGVTNVSGIQSVFFNEDISINLNGFGAETYDELGSLRTSIQKQSVLDTLRASGLAVRIDNSITNVAFGLSSSIEPRFVYDLTFGIGNSSTDDVSFINDVDITKTITT